jgi:hypothetical protein
LADSDVSFKKLLKMQLIKTIPLVAAVKAAGLVETLGKVTFTVLHLQMPLLLNYQGS